MASANKDRAAEIANTFEWLITAFILALFFRAFVMEAYRIPTGSMADTLKGEHFRMRCSQCGYRYDYGFGNYGLPPDTVIGGRIKTLPTRCPSCGCYQPVGGQMPVANGDRILVLKCIYQFFEPLRWDVVVFKNPLDPPINYIKRLVGCPGETVEIIDGDIYINGQIARKPPKVQQELWMPVYDNDYQPVQPRQPAFNGHSWQQPFKNLEGSDWKTDQDSPVVFRLECPDDQVNYLIYDTSIGNDFKASYAYDDVETYAYMPYCSDLKVRFYARMLDQPGSIGIELSKYQTRYKACVDSAGEMVISKLFEGQETILARRPAEQSAVGKPVLVQFINVDHQLIFQLGRDKLTFDLGSGPEDAGPRKTAVQPNVKIFGSGSLTISHIAIFRDIHYTAKKFAGSSEQGRALEGSPFTLGKDEFFVLGDNSPNSEDARWWSQKGIANNNRFYRPGIVPREYLVGKALFVYWPSFFRPFGKSPIFVPNIGQMRFIYGGSGR